MADTQRLPNDDTTAFAQAVQDGVLAADCERVVPYEDVRRWLLFWARAKSSIHPRAE